ncbi:ABC transporter permease [Bacillus suaedaesalsae]|uniref:ABC transporter permease n=1 Tax=Bacillus suaedaesalsae TaxID=2810349 RepID=A0ABS2DJ49_9BACI|nr:FtsX-like permease family protein [Bacillus suaedaesalsae]MBM6617576.1 ABC transporter permease [Bacillus suaedaesalsae]
MKFNDQVKLVRRNMKKNRLRVFMTILATTMGCAFLIMLASVGFGIHKSVTEEIKKQQILTEVQVNGSESKDGYKAVSKEDVEDIKKIGGVKAVVTRITSMGQLEAKLDDRKGDVMAVITNMEEEIKAGMTLDKGRLPEKENEIVIGYHFASQLLTEKELSTEAQEGETRGYTGELLNKEISFTLTTETDGEKVSKDFAFKIVGIKKEPSRDWIVDSNVYVGESLRDELIPPGSIPKDFDMPLYNEVKAYAKDMQSVQIVTEELKSKGYLVYSVTEELEQMNMFFTALKAGLIFVGTVAVLIASIGIFNTMTMAVTERTQEIGIMKAVGAQPNIIKRLFLMESAYIGIMGSAIGVAISYAISMLANKVIPIIINSTTESDGSMDFTFSYIPVSLVVIAASISIGVAIVSGLRPAMKATSINVLSALRREL